MNETNTQLVATQPPKPPMIAGDRGLQLRSIEDYWRLANYISASGLAPKGIDKPESILVAMQLGAEIGLPPLASLQNMAVINGKPALFGDAMLAVVRGTGELVKFAEWYEMDGKRIPSPPSTTIPDQFCAVCFVQRRGEEPVTSVFSVCDAKRAQLWGKQGPWMQYPTRMLRFRARAFALRDTFGDALKGMRSTEELQDAQAIDIQATVQPSVFTPATKTESAAPTEAAAAAPTPAEAQPTEQEQAQQIVEQAGFTLPQFCEWAEAGGYLSKPYPEVWPALDVDLAKRIVRAKVGVVTGLRKTFQPEAK